MKKKKKATKQKVADGFYWEVWKDNVCVESGFNDGVRDIKQLNIPIPVSALDSLYTTRSKS